MFRAITNFFRKIGYLITGKVDDAGRDLARNPHVIQATFDKVVREKKDRINQYKDAVARMIAQEETKKARLKSLTDEIVRLSQLKQGAAAKAKQTVEAMKNQGKSMEEIKQSEDYQRCLAAFNDFSSSLAEKEDHVLELESDIKEIESTIGGHKVQLQALLREIDKIKQEANETVADVLTAREEEEINQMLVGISDDQTSKDLEEMREIRQQQKAKATISRELAGTDTKVQENEFLAYASANAANDEFDQLIGLAGEAEGATTTADTQTDAKLPE